MLGKLLKYEIPSVGRKLGPLYVAWLAVSILFGLTAGRLTNSNLVTLISALVYFGVTVAVFVMAIVLIIQRYNNSLLGDEAYFNLTLPVKPGTHILSKTITSLVWTVLTMLTAFLSAVLIIVSAGGLNAFWNGEPIDWAVWWNEIGKQFFTPDAILLIIELLIASVLSIVKSILAVYAAITIGHLVPKYVIPASIVAYIGIAIFESTVGSASVGLLGFASEQDSRRSNWICRIWWKTDSRHRRGSWRTRSSSRSSSRLCTSSSANTFWRST